MIRYLLLFIFTVIIIQAKSQNFSLIHDLIEKDQGEVEASLNVSRKQVFDNKTLIYDFIYNPDNNKIIKLTEFLYSETDSKAINKIFLYDSLNNLMRITIKDGNNEVIDTCINKYNSDGLIITKVCKHHALYSESNSNKLPYYSGISGIQVKRYKYDSDNRMSKCSINLHYQNNSNDFNHIEYYYNTSGQLTKMRLINPDSVTLSTSKLYYSNDNELKKIITTSNNSQIGSIKFFYSKSGLTKVIDKNNVNTTKWTFTPDGLIAKKIITRDNVYTKMGETYGYKDLQQVFTYKYEF